MSGLKTVSLTQFARLKRYWTRYWLTPVLTSQETINFDTARLFITTIFSSAPKPLGGAFSAFNNEIFLGGNASPNSILLYLPSIYVSPVITKLVFSCSSTLITLKNWGLRSLLDNIQIECWAGVWDNAEAKVITPVVELTLVVLTSSDLPSGNKTKHFWFPPVNVSRSFTLSTVILVVVAVLILPDLLSDALTGSATAITLPGLTIAPASIEVVNVTVSDSCSSLKTIAFANLRACFLEVHPNAFTVFLTIPYLAILAAWTGSESSSPYTS